MRRRPIHREISREKTTIAPFPQLPSPTSTSSPISSVVAVPILKLLTKSVAVSSSVIRERCSTNETSWGTCRWLMVASTSRNRFLCLPENPQWQTLHRRTRTCGPLHSSLNLSNHSLQIQIHKPFRVSTPCQSLLLFPLGETKRHFVIPSVIRHSIL